MSIAHVEQILLHYLQYVTVDTGGFLQLTLLLMLLGGDNVVSTFLHGPQDVFVIRVQVMVKAKKVKLGVVGLLSFQDDLKLSPLLRYKFGGLLDDVVGLDGCRLQKQGHKNEQVCFKMNVSNSKNH